MLKVRLHLNFQIAKEKLGPNQNLLFRLFYCRKKSCRKCGEMHLKNHVIIFSRLWIRGANSTLLYASRQVC
jgi:hypothetical protein